MIKFYLVDGKVKFLIHKVEWQEMKKQRNENGESVNTEIIRTANFYDANKKDSLLTALANRDITPTVTEYEQPSAEILAKCEGKKFETYKEAKDFVEGAEIPLTEAEVLALAITELYEMISGGAV